MRHLTYTSSMTVFILIICSVSRNFPHIALDFILTAILFSKTPMNGNYGLDPF